MAARPFSSDDLKEKIDLVRKLQGTTWEAVADNEAYLAALDELTEIFGHELGITTGYEFFQALQNPKSTLYHSLTIFEESKLLGDYVDKTEIDNSQVATLLREYQEYLSQQAEDQLHKKKRKTTAEWVEELLEKRKKTPAQLAAVVAVRLAKDSGPETIPSVAQTETALRTEQTSREKTLEVASRQGTAPVEHYAEEVLRRVETENNLSLTPEEHDNAKTVMMASLLVAAIPFSSEAASLSLGDEEAEIVKTELEQAAQKINELKTETRTEAIKSVAAANRTAINGLSQNTSLTSREIEEIAADSHPIESGQLQAILGARKVEIAKPQLEQAAAQINQLKQQVASQTQHPISVEPQTLENLALVTGITTTEVEHLIKESSIPIKVSQLEDLRGKQTTTELVEAVLSQTTNKKVPSPEAIRKSLDNIVDLDRDIDAAQKNVRQTHEVLIRHDAYYQPPLTTSLNEKNLAVITKTYNDTFSDVPLAAFATHRAARTAEAIKGDVSNKGFAVAVELHSRGLTLQKFRDLMLLAQTNSELKRSFSQNRLAFRELETYLTQIERSPILSQELQRPPQSSGAIRYARITQRFETFLPQRFITPYRIITNPRGWVTQTLGRRAGSFFAGKVASSAALSSAKAMVLRLGAKTGLASLAAKMGLAAAGIGGGPVGWALIVGQAAMAVAGKIFQPFLDFVGARNLGEAARDTVLGGVVLLATLPMMIASAVTLTAVVPFAFIGLILGILFWFIPTINIAPILSTMVQLESAPSTFNQLRPEDILPPGEVPESCPGGYPTSNRSISQGPNVGSHARWQFSINLRDGGNFPTQNQAVDFGMGSRPPQDVRSTHNGQAYAFPEHTQGVVGFGNFVVVLADCEEIRFVSVYAHLSSALIPLGGPTTVTKGQVIGLTGNSGLYGDRHHLHYELMTQASPFDILSWLTR